MLEAIREPRRHEGREVFVMSDFDPVSRAVVDCCFQVHRKLGTGLLEDIYEEPVCIELQKKGLSFEAQKQIPVFYEGQKLKKAFRLDIVVENAIILELKAMEKILPIHEAQILTYLKITGIKIGFIVNFREPYFKAAIRRFVL